MDNHRQAERPVMVEAYLMAGRLQARRGGLGDVQQVVGLGGLVIPPRRDRTRQQQTAPHRDLLWLGRAKTRLDAVGLPHGQPPRMTRAAGLVHQQPGHPPIGSPSRGTSTVWATGTGTSRDRLPTGARPTRGWAAGPVRSG